MKIQNKLNLQKKKFENSLNEYCFNDDMWKECEKEGHLGEKYILFYGNGSIIKMRHYHYFQ